MADVQATATLNVKQILDALNQVDKTNDKVWKNAEKSANRAIKGIIADHKRLTALTSKLDRDLAGNAKGFGDIGKSAQASGVQIGFVAGAVSAVTTEIIQLGQQAVRVFADIIADSVKLAAGFESKKSLIKNIFEGDEEAANAVIDRLVKRGSEIGLLPDVAVGLGVSFAPDVGSLEQLDKFIEGAVKLKQFAPEKTFEDIRFSLEQLISGDPRAFQDRLNLPLETIKRARELQKEYGKIDGSLKLLDEIFKKFGINLETVTDTSIGKLGQLQAKLQQLQLVGGEQALESIKPFLEELIAFLETNRDELILFAASLGDTVGSVVEFVQSLSGLADLKPGDITQFGDDIFAFVEQLKLGAEIVGGFLGIVGELLIAIDPTSAAFNAAGIDVSEFFAEFGKGQGPIIGFLDLLAQSKAGLEGILVVLQAGIESASIGLQSIAALASGDFGKAQELSTASNDVLTNSLIAGQQAVRESYAESKKALDEYTQAVKDHATSQENLKNKLGQTNDAGDAAAAAFLKQQQAMKDAAKAAEELAEAQAKVDEAMAKIETDFQRDLLQADIKFERARTDTLLDGQRKREKAARENRQKIADIEKKNNQAIADLDIDLRRDLRDISINAGRAQIEQRKDEAEKIIDIETDTRRKIADIIDKSQIDLDEAAEKRDAISFLRILKQRNKEISGAQQDASREIKDTQLGGQRKRDELLLQQQQQREDARRADVDRFADLQTDLARELEAQGVAFAREREQIAINEAEKLVDLATARERDREDAARNRDEKLADLQLSMAEELSIIQAGNAAIEEEARRHAVEMAAAAAAARVQSQANADDDRPSSRPGAQNRRRQRAGQPGSRPGFINTGRASGGPVGAGQSFLVGERGPELFTPNISGVIIPNQRAMISSGSGAAGGVNNFNNQRAINAPITMADPNSLSAVQRAIVRAEILAIMNQID